LGNGWRAHTRRLGFRHDEDRSFTRRGRLLAMERHVESSRLFFARDPKGRNDADEVMRQTCHLLALVSHHTGIVEAPDNSEAAVRRVDLIPVTRDRMGILIADNLGRVQTTMIAIDKEFASDDLHVSVRAQWDNESLYVAIEWTDDVWDIRKIRRSEAVLVASDRKRYDRMLFYDNFKFQIESLKYDYLLWVSPRVNDEGPYYWQRRREGLGSMEGATSPPVITPRQNGRQVTMELLFFWKELRLKPKELVKKGFPLFMTVADSDQPGYIEEGKLPHLKSLSWNGNGALTGK